MALTLPGHEVLHGGSAVDDELLPTGEKVGVGVCACGDRSDELPSTGARRGWHRAHTAQLRAELAADSLDEA